MGISSLILREVEMKQVNWSAHDTDILLTEHIKEFLPNGFHGFDKSRMSNVLIYIFAITSPSLNVDSCHTCNPYYKYDCTLYISEYMCEPLPFIRMVLFPYVPVFCEDFELDQIQ